MKSRFLFCLSLVCLLFACNKDKNDDSIHNYIQGSWKLVKVGVDLNGNDNLESNEAFPLPESALVSTFYDDGTGMGSVNFSSLGNSLPFTWTTDERAQLVTINSQGSSYTAKFMVHDIDNFSLLNEDMNIFNNKIWMVYSREK